jgi:acyl-CoA reductase-like NAD-dependent aldehyde dehydrogenase
MTTTIRGAAAPTSQGADRSDVDVDLLETTVAAVAARAEAWALTTPQARARLLDQIIEDTVAIAPQWLAAACAAKGLDARAGSGGEELFSGVGTFVTMARTLKESILEIQRTGRPQYPGPVKESSDGRLVVQVFPSSTYDRLLYAKTTGEVWIEPGITRAELEANQALAYKDPEEHKGVSLVLGAGNVASLGPRDVLSKLFVEGKVVVLKANPVNDYLVPYWTAAMKALIDRGFLAIVEGGAEAGKFLCNHDHVDEIHVTGSDKTHDAIVFGVGEEGARRKAANEPLIAKHVSCELGNVSPVIIVPGAWSEKDLDFQAEHVATMLTNNAGFNCLTPRVLILWDGWNQRQEFLSKLQGVLAATPARRPYYPGAEERRAAFLAEHPEALELGHGGPGTAPWTFIRGVESANHDDICFNVEAFCGLMSETALPAADEAAFVDAAVAFANDVVWGTLSATILAHPSSMSDPVVGPRIDQAVADLRYGGIGVNLWHALVFALSTTTWGAYPGHPITDIQSGSGVVGNAYMLPFTQKSVVRGPFRASPKPAWFVTAKNSGPTMEKLLKFEASPSMLKLPGLFAAALRN